MAFVMNISSSEIAGVVGHPNRNIAGTFADLSSRFTDNGENREKFGAAIEIIHENRQFPSTQVNNPTVAPVPSAGRNSGEGRST